MKKNKKKVTCLLKKKRQIDSVEQSKQPPTKKKRRGGFCTKIDAISVPPPKATPAAELATPTSALQRHETQQQQSPSPDRKILVEAKSSSWTVVRDTFISKRNERINSVKAIINGMDPNSQKNFYDFEHVIMSIIQDHELQKVTQMVLRRNFKLNSSHYFISILKKALMICEQVDSRLQHHSPEVITEVKYDALFIYKYIIMATGAALRRIRTPLNQLEMCHRVAALVNGQFTGAYNADELCTTSLIQFVSGLPSYYSKIVPHIGDIQLCINSIVREHNFNDEMRAKISLLIEMVSVLSKSVSEKKPMNIVQGACRFLCRFLNQSFKDSTPNTAKQISNYIESITSQHNITEAMLSDVVSLKLSKPFYTHIRNSKICALSSLTCQKIATDFNDATLLFH